MAREIRDGKGIVRCAIYKIGGECTSRSIPSPVGQLGLQNAGSAGAEKYANALRAVFCNGNMHRPGKAILHQSKLREPVVAAIKVGQVSRELHSIHPCYFANEGRQIHRIKCARRQSGAALAQRGERLVEAATDAAGCGEMGEPKRVQRKVGLSCIIGQFNKLQWSVWIK